MLRYHLHRSHRSSINMNIFIWATFGLLCIVSAYGRNTFPEAFTIQLDSEAGDNDDTVESRHGEEILSRVNKGKICIGTPCQNFTVMFDTGSADLWVASTRCKGDPCALFPNKYDHSKSSTYSNNGKHEVSSLQYGTGHDEGMQILWSTEKVMVGKDMIAKNASYGEVIKTNKAIGSAHLDGILGLGYKSLAHHGRTPVFYKLIENKAVPQSVFTFCKSSDDSISEVTFGSTSSQYYKNSTPVYTKVTKELHWQFHLDSVIVNGEAIDSCGEEGCDGVADSGTTLIRGPKNLIDQVNSAFGGYYNKKTKHYEVDCKKKDSLPDVEFIVEGQSFTLSNDRYVIERKGVCMTAFQVTGSSFKGWVLGGPFLQGLCTIYDLGNNRLGFAKMDEEDYDDDEDDDSSEE